MPSPLWSVAIVGVLLTGGCQDFSFSKRDSEVRDPVIVEETFQQEALPQTDILWVIDNTSSMADEIATLAEALGSFADELDTFGVNWQVGLITADIQSEHAGRLLGDPWILTPDVEDPATTLQTTAALATDGQTPEAPLGAAWLALTEPLASGDNRAFRRDDAALHVIVVSDADDDSAEVLGQDPAGAFVTFLASEAERTGRPARLSAVVGDTPSGCTWDGGSALPGAQLAAVAEQTGGVVASICAQDLSEVTAACSEASVAWPDTFPLQATPAPDSVRVAIDGTRQEDGWEVVGAELHFEVAPAPGAEIAVRYEVAE